MLLRRLLLAVVVSLSAAGLFAAPKTLHFGNGTEPQDLDPHTVTGVPEHHLLDALFEGLVVPSPESDHEVIPGVAEKWETSPDGRVYTFHLRANAKWSNGDPVTAADFVKAHKRILTPSLAAEYAEMLYLVAGAEEFHKGKTTDFEQVGVKAVDEHTLRYTLRQPTPFFIRTLVHYSWYPVHMPTVEKHGGLEKKGSRWTRVENFVGNGPFVLKAWLPNQKIVTERSPTYWDRANVKLDELHFFAVDVLDTEERMFRSGQLHITNEVPRSKLATYRRTSPDVLRIDPYCGIYFYRFNVSKKPFDDVRVRRALALSIDRESLVRNVTAAGETPAYHVVPPDVGGYKSEHKLSANLAEARRLLADAGYPGGKGFPKAEILFNTSEKHRAVAEALQQMWRRNLGIEVGLYNQEWKVYLDAQDTGNFQLCRAGWIADYVDPHVFLDLWRTGGGNNDTRWSNAEYDRLLGTALTAPNNEARYAIYQQMEKILIDEVPILPIYFYTHPRLISPKVKNYRTTYIDNYPWKYVDLAE
jgi:oligopeptide transport system substrate-binding protein